MDKFENHIREENRKTSAHSCQAAWFHYSHKATLPELIEHFRK